MKLIKKIKRVVQEVLQRIHLSRNHGNPFRWPGAVAALHVRFVFVACRLYDGYALSTQ